MYSALVPASQSHSFHPQHQQEPIYTRVNSVQQARQIIVNSVTTSADEKITETFMWRIRQVSFKKLAVKVVNICLVLYTVQCTYIVPWRQNNLVD
jgi:hypothetical protein